MHKYDLFICHSFEDKDQFVRPLCDRLRDLNYRVWYDEFTLNIGDSLRRSIDRGLRESRFGVVVLSPSFFGKNWTKYELDALVSRENDSGDKIILPIWHSVGKSDVMAYSATLADRVSANSAEGIDEVVRKIADVLKIAPSEIGEDEKYLTLADELAEFKHKFCSSDLDNYFDVLVVSPFRF